MRQRMRTIQQSERVSGLYGLLALLVTLHYLIVYAERYLIWTGHEPLFNGLRVVHALLIVLLLLLCVLKLRRGMPPEFWLLAAFCGWVLITRVINRDYTLYGSLYFSAVCFAVFAVGNYLTPEQRRRLLITFSAVTGAYLFFLSVWGLVIWFGGSDAFPTVAAFISKNPFSKIKDIVFFNTTHNMSAAWFLVSLFLSAYVWTETKERFWHVLLAVHMALMLVMIALLHCRSIQVACSIGSGMLAALYVLPRLREKKLAVRSTAIVLTALFGLLICFEAISLCGDLFAKGMKISQREWDTYYTEQAEKGNPLQAQSAAPGVSSSSDSRSFLHDALTLTERTLIWEAAFKLAGEDAHAALFGQAEEHMMDAVNARGNYKEVKQHTHNMVIQALVLTGIPGALLLIAFVMLQLVRMIRAYFDMTGRIGMEHKVLLVLQAVLLLYGMAEVLLSRLVGFASVSFLLSGGIFTEIEREAFQSQ